MMNMDAITPEMLEKAKRAATAEELLAMAKENGTELTPEQAGAAFAKLHCNGGLADDELVNVSGGYVRAPVDPESGKPMGKSGC